MSMLGGLLNKIFNKDLSFKNPIFIKDFKEKNNVILELEKIMNQNEGYYIEKVKSDLSLFKAGVSGEKNIAYELQNSHMPILILHDLMLKYEEISAQIDYVVIGQKFILIIECKNMVGDIEITSDGSFIRHYKNFNGRCYKKEGMYSPITQNERHMALVNDILLKENVFKESMLNKILIHKVVVANPKTIINSKYAKKNIKEQIVKLDQLVNILRKINDNKEISNLSEDVMKKIGSILLKYNSEERILNTDKYKIEKEHINEEQNEQTVKEDYTKPIMENDPLYIKLKEYRLNKSKEDKVKPYYIYNNSVMEELVMVKPRTIEELKKIKGFGPVKSEKYGEDILGIIMEC